MYRRVIHFDDASFQEQEDLMEGMKKQVQLRKGTLFLGIGLMLVSYVFGFSVWRNWDFWEEEYLVVCVLAYQIPILLSIFVPCILIAMCKNFQEEYEDNFIHYFLKYVIKDKAPDLTLDVEDGFYQTDIKALGYVYLDGFYVCGNSVEGHYGEITFQWADIGTRTHKTWVNANGERRDYYGGFSACATWMTFEFEKMFPTNLQITEIGFHGERKEPCVSGMNHDDIIHNVDLGDEEFQKIFHVRCVDERFASDMLTPELMNAIKELESKIKRKILVGFHEQKLHLAIDSSFRKFPDPRFYMKMYYHDFVKFPWRLKTMNQNIQKVQEHYHAIFEFVDVVQRLI